MKKKIDLFAVRAHIEGCIWPQLHKFADDDVLLKSVLKSTAQYEFRVISDSLGSAATYIHDEIEIYLLNEVIVCLNNDIKRIVIPYLKEGETFNFIPPFNPKKD